MESELSFLISLLLNDDVPKDIRVLLKDRIKAVEESFKKPTIPIPIPGAYVPLQAQSTQRILDQMEQPLPIITSPAVANAIAERQKAVSIAVSGSPEKGRISPRKF